MVSPLTLLAHFAEEIGGLEVTDAVTLISEIPGHWSSDPRLPQYIISMEEAQKNAKRGGLSITENWIAAFATSSLLLANSLPNNFPEWDGNPKADQTWKAWKDTFNPFQKISSARYTWRGGIIPLAQRLPPNSYMASTPTKYLPRPAAKLPVSPRAQHYPRTLTPTLTSWPPSPIAATRSPKGLLASSPNPPPTDTTKSKNSSRSLNPPFP